ncbi:MAG: C-GCAxxG-C-C family (seleno)protein [Bdellovibrionota bacterium]
MCNYQKLITKYFRGHEGYNCAQTVLKVLSIECNNFNITDSSINEAKAFGGGRAESGYCGALFGALSALDNKEIANKLIEKFKTEIGNLTCKEIRKENKKSCKDCVSCALKFFLDDENTRYNIERENIIQEDIEYKKSS